MKKKTVASLAIVTAILFSSAAFAETNEQVLIEDLNKQLVQELSKEDLLASTQGYLLEKIERPQARRSALFAHILDTLAKNATLAKADKISHTVDS